MTIAEKLSGSDIAGVAAEGARRKRIPRLLILAHGVEGNLEIVEVRVVARREILVERVGGRIAAAEHHLHAAFLARLFDRFNHHVRDFTEAQDVRTPAGEGAVRLANKYPEMFASTIGYAGGFVSPQTLQKYRPRIYSEMFKNLVDRFERFMTQTYIAENADKCRGRIGIRLVCGTADDSIELQRQIVSLGARYGLEIEGI